MDSSIDVAREFWMLPDTALFPFVLQSELLSGRSFARKHLGAMSLVHNGVQLGDVDSIDRAESVLQSASRTVENTGQALVLTRDIAYMGLYRQIAEQKSPNYGRYAQKAFDSMYVMAEHLKPDTKTVSDTVRSMYFKDRSGALAEQLVVCLFTDEGIGAVPSYPWQDRPHGVGQYRGVRSPAFDIRILSGNTAFKKAQVKASLNRSPIGVDGTVRVNWRNLSLADRKRHVQQTYDVDIACIALDADLGVKGSQSEACYRNMLRRTPQTTGWRQSIGRRAVAVLGRQ